MSPTDTVLHTRTQLFHNVQNCDLFDGLDDELANLAKLWSYRLFGISFACMFHQLPNWLRTTMQNAIIDSVMSPSELVCRLQDVSCYPHSVAGQVEVNETHISWILLAGHFAYKIKKPITTDFLDYGTLEKRHHACCEELRLNARYADGMYLDVVPITIEDDQVRMDGDALPIEFAVRMRRFPEGSLLSERLDFDQVSGSEINQLAKTVATIHHRAVADRGAMENKVASIHDQAMANFEYLQRDSLLCREDALRSIQEWTEATFLRLQKVFYLRIQEGFIRECHGDLHCDNVVFWHDHWVPFDGIEFNPKYSWIDVLSDIGFLVMDLESRQSSEFSATLLNSYLEQTGDYEDLSLLRWYYVYRALVRAKVSVLRAQQCASNSQEQSIQIEKARNFLNLALTTTQPKLCRLWITHGVSGSGKTTGSQRLVESQGAIRLRSDVERKRHFGYSPAQQKSAGIGQGMYSAKASEWTYQILFLRALSILKAGFSVVVDATFLKLADRQRFHGLALEHGIEFHILNFDVDEATLRRRVTNRSLTRNDASDADLAVLERQLVEQEPLTEAELKLVDLSNCGPTYMT